MLNTFPIIFALLILDYCSSVNSHGRLMEPPNRSSLWRFPEFKSQNPPINYDDNQLYCGGSAVHYGPNKGKCGPCGDSYSDSIPRDNESGGKYGRGIIVRSYMSGQNIPVSVELTQTHLGYFEFHLCPHNSPQTPEEESCFSAPLPLADGSGTKYPISTSRTGRYNMSLELPPKLVCSQCVLRWNYRAGNAYGNCGNGKSAVGCGNQVTFRGCADIRIL